MVARTRTLTVNLHDISDENLTEGSVSVGLTGADEALPTSSEPGRQILPNPKTEDIEAGQVAFALIPTDQLKGGQLYALNFGAGTINFRMPDQDTTLYDLLATSPVTPDLPSVLGANPPDGTMAAIRANNWIRYNPVWIADSAPAVFFPGRTLWLDTSGGGQQLKYRGATSWVDIAGGGGGGGLTQSQVDARIALLVRPYARSTFANLDSVGTADIEDADALLWFDQSDSAEGKKLTYGAFRARVADDEVADWAQENNTDAIPASKLSNAPSGGGGGLNQAQVDARVTAGVADWAEAGDTDQIPANKLGNAAGLTQAQVDARVTAGVLDWAETGDTDQIPANKLGNVPSQLVDDSISPAMLQADSDAQKLAMRQRIGVTQGRGSAPWETHTITVGTNPDSGDNSRGYEAGIGGNTAYGSATTNTLVRGDDVTYTILGFNTDDADGNLDLIVRTPTGQPPITGDDSILNDYLTVGEHSVSMSQATRSGTLNFGSPEATLFTFGGLGSLIPAVGQTVTISISGALDRILETRTTRDLADVASTVATDGQILTYVAASSEYQPTTPAAGGGGLETGDSQTFFVRENSDQSGNGPDNYVVPLNIDGTIASSSDLATYLEKYDAGGPDITRNIGGFRYKATATGDVIVIMTMTPFSGGQPVRVYKNADPVAGTGTLVAIPPGGHTSTLLFTLSPGDTISLWKGEQSTTYNTFNLSIGILAGSGSGGAATPLSDATPQPTGTAAAGTSTSASRGDHVHASAGGLNQAAVDARVRAVVEDWAEVGTTGRIPRSRLPVADAEVYIARSPAADVAVSNDASDGSFGNWATVATLPALAATEAGRLRFDGLVLLDSSADARTAAGGSRIGAEVRIVRTRGTVPTPLVTDAEYGPRNLSNGSTEFQSTNQRKSATVWAYDTGRTGDVYTLQARIATQEESRAITVQATTASSLVAYRAASGGGAGAAGQSGASNQHVVFLWQRAASTPAVPAGGVWADGWTTVPTGWAATPGEAAGTDPLYQAVGRATLTAGDYVLGHWTVSAVASFSTRYSDSLNGANPYEDVRSSSVAFSSRLANGQWSSYWQPIAQPPDWQYLGEATLDVTSTGQVKIITFPTDIDIYEMREVRFEVSLWQSTGQLIDFASSTDLSTNLFGVENHNAVSTSPHANSILSVVLESDDGLRVMVGSGTSLPTSSETAGAKCYFRRNNAASAYGNTGSLYFYEWSRTDMRGYIRVRVR